MRVNATHTVTDLLDALTHLSTCDHSETRTAHADDCLDGLLERGWMLGRDTEPAA